MSTSIIFSNALHVESEGMVRHLTEMALKLAFDLSMLLFLLTHSITTPWFCCGDYWKIFEQKQFNFNFRALHLVIITYI